MKSYVARALVLAALQLLIVGTLAAKYRHDRQTLPRVWVRTANYDPDLPIRGRYVALSLQPEASGIFEEKPLIRRCTDSRGMSVPCKDSDSGNATYQTDFQFKRARLEVRDNRLVAVADPNGTVQLSYFRDLHGQSRVNLSQPVDLFLPEHAANVPGWRTSAPGTEWWVEVSVPRNGPPRSLRLGVRRSGGDIEPMPAN